MPGPVSDTYDPEFSTAENAREVKRAIRDVVVHSITPILGHDLHNILEIIHGKPDRKHAVELTEQQLRVIRFALNRAVESI